jgi:hypothetical protein
MTTPNTTLIDATAPVTVKIGAQDQNAVQASPSGCVIANRLQRMPGVHDVRVGAKTVRIQRQDGWHRYDLDPDSAAAVRAYDLAGQPMPVGFRVTLTPPARPLTSRQGERQGSKRRSGKGHHVSTRRPSTRSIFIEPKSSA